MSESSSTRYTTWAKCRNACLLLILWEAAGQFEWVANGALPAISDIFIQLWNDRSDYPEHISATVYSSGAGFLIGNAIAVLAGMLFVLSPVAARLTRGLNITIFALPPIVIAPILALTLSGNSPRIVLAAMGCYFITMSATVIGLTQFDARSADVVKAYGGGRWKVMQLVQFRGAVPVILSGLRVAAPSAVLGAILAEFGGGGRWGLGSYLLGSLGRGDPARLWGIGLIATLIAGSGYVLFAIVSGRMLGASRAVTVTTAAPSTHSPDEAGGFKAWALTLGSIALPLLVWWAFVRLLSLPEMIAKTPIGVFDYLFLADASAIARAKILAAFSQTLPIALVGMFAGLLAAFLLAISGRLFPRTIQTLMPIALVTQTMPLVALTPLLVLILGRGYSLILWVTISVTFFPAFVTLAQGLALVPRSALDVARAYGASTWKEMRLITIPSSLPYLFASIRLTVPRALLGVMIAEWLATGTGLGNLLNQSRGYLDFGMIWTVAALSVIVSIVFYQLVVFCERRVLRRMGMQTSE